MKAFMLPGRLFLILMMSVLPVSCSHLPVIKPVDPVAVHDTIQRCRQPFLDIPYRFVHAIEAALPGGGQGTVVGVTVFDPASQIIHSVIMTIEGFVLFDARYEKRVFVNRAVPPFNAEQFAGNMMEDVRLMFLAPDGRLSDAGVLEDGSTVCRYYGNQDKIVDVIIRADNTWEIGRYSDHHVMLRKIRASSVRDRIPARLELTAFGFREYSLRLNLISAEPVSPDAVNIGTLPVFMIDDF
jgi:hypothetical protein